MSTPGPRTSLTLTPSQATQLGTDAFAFGFPLLLMAAAMRRATSVSTPQGDRAPLNSFAHLHSFPGDDCHAIVGANPDTLYSLAWLDLNPGPILLELPGTGGRSYLLPLVDAWGNIFASIGPRTGNTNGGRTYAIAGPHFDSELPEELHHLAAPTNSVWAIWQLHAAGRSDLERARTIQDGLKLIPLGDNGASEGPPTGSHPRLDTQAEPHRLVMMMDTADFLTELATQMGGNPPTAIDVPLLDRLASIDLYPGKPFDFMQVPPAIREALADGIKEGKENVAQPPEQRIENGWQVVHPPTDSYGSDYLQRARFANLALGISPPEDAVFPVSSIDADGRPLSGNHRYLLRFEPGGLPPVSAHWSLALYDMDQLPVKNPIDRYALGDRDELEIGADGSLEIAIQHDRPNGSSTNWLPAPEDDFTLMLHMYWPNQKALDGSWAIPPVRRVNAMGAEP